MEEILVILVIGLVVIAAATLLGERFGVASPLILVAVGVGASFLPLFDSIQVDPELILQGVLPPLLYSAAVSMPTMNFRREFGAISGLSVLLVVVSALLLGLFFMLVIPGLGFAWGVALGAIISPTDAVATSIIKRSPVSPRVVALLDGESLLNDATALVVLRTAIVATAATFSFWGSVGTFAYSVAIAIVIGVVVAALNLAVRRRITSPTVNTVISFTVPFLASVPAELLGASGLVAAVVAGLITGIRAPRELSPQHRLSDSQNWRTVELVLEGAVFLTMGIQIKAIITDVERDHAGVGVSLVIAFAALALIILIRAAYVAPLLAVLSRLTRRGANMQGQLQGLQEKLADPNERVAAYTDFARGRAPKARDAQRFATRVTRVLADIDYFRRQPLGWREGTIVVWAGMRGAVTVAAAQILPEETPARSVIVLIAFAVALFSLTIQGGTLAAVIRRLGRAADKSAAEIDHDAETAGIMDLLMTTAKQFDEPATVEGEPRLATFARRKEYRLTVLRAQRTALLDARDNGTFDADVLEKALADLDASEIAIEMRG
ncbi:CPA1 family monovalent cation:H+ antiporter [Leifsonia sp. AK011]|uniref:cation:proton antiporter n=1 Tax=Leifsonia sp. AK011 TaxID=2723075 RepID=UPI0015C88D72|nr:sodium:proton antiporter [Leifsonia sp. AK011]NYF11312.1 CPA1 family monovalent cation:H+ antiporter [Leifsonia sp. AK011]